MRQSKLIRGLVIALVLAALAGTGVYAKGGFTTSAANNASMFAPPPPGGFRLSDEALQAAADVLGITADELSAALEAGTTFEELATTAGVDVQDVFDAIRSTMPGPGRGFGGGQPHDFQLSDEGLQAAADALGMTTDELSAALEAGSTLEELATAAGVDFQTVMDAIHAVMPAPNGGPGGPGDFQLSDEALQAAADALGMTTDELSAALESGSTLEDLATAAGVDFQTVMDAIRAVMPAPDGQHGSPGKMQLSDDALQAAADALGMTTDELSAALESGSTLEELATAAGVDFQTVMDAIHTTMPAGGPPQDGQGPPDGQQNGQFPDGQPGQNPGGQPGQNPGGQPPSGRP